MEEVEEVKKKEGVERRTNQAKWGSRWVVGCGCGAAGNARGR